jgi:AraC-like DNA-binding protein
VRLHLLGIFAQFAGPEHEVAGTLGASLQLLDEDSIQFRQEIVNGRHYSDARKLEPVRKVLGDGMSVETVGKREVEGQALRVDLMTLDIPEDLDVSSFKFKALASPASFTIFDVFLEHQMPHGCPFHSEGEGVPLAKIGAILRLQDRVEFGKALALLKHALLQPGEIDEARGQALTFLAVVTAAMLETGGSRSLLKEQLLAARELEHCDTGEQVWRSIEPRIEKMASGLMHDSSNPTDHLIDRALALVERNYARQITDAAVAQQLGLSTSHFRHLFRQATGQPFHKYLIAVRLEKARQMLVDEQSPVGSVAKSVGFLGISHFTRAFVQRFGITPSHARRA